MREDGSVKNTEKYTIAEYENRGLRLEDLAERIASQLDSHFILYDYKGNIYTDNDDVIQILKDEYPSGDYPSYGNPIEGFGHDNMNIEWDRLLQLQEDNNYIWIDYHYIPKWYYIYRKLAKLLIDFRGHDILVDDSVNNNFIGSLLYRELTSDKDFITNNEWVIKFGSVWKVRSLDPIHIFASLNGNKLGNTKRISRINILFRILDENFEDDYKNINFDGCPAPMIVSIIGARDEDSQKEVWNLFYEIMNKSQSSNVNFSQIPKWYGIDIGAFTIFLFWIDAKNFLPLDKNTESLLKKYHKIDKLPTTYAKYKKLLTTKKTNLYLLLALVSYDNKKQELLSEENKQKLLNYLESKEYVTLKKDLVHSKKKNKVLDISLVKKEHIIEESNNFKLISIKPLPKCNKQYLKTLKEDELYIFDKAYTIDDEGIKVNKKIDLSLFDLKNLNININAIVGKNGTGKSTIVELLFALINNISYMKKVNKDIIKIDELKVELIFESTSLYKIIVYDDTLKVYQYEKEGNQYTNPKKLDNNKFSLDELFYSIAVNYSQHSLNSLHMGLWIDSLFHKNDAYQTPIVIEPYREEGNFNINRQEELIKQRLLSNLLLQEDSDDKKNTPRQLTEFYRAESLELIFDLKKIFYKTDDIRQIDIQNIYKDEKNDIALIYRSFENEYIDILKILYKKYDIKIIPNKSFGNDDFRIYTFEDKVHLYILKKLVSIVIRYKKYQDFFNLTEVKFNNINKYINTLYKDTSHICYKLKQAINFLKFESLIEKKEDKQFLNIEELSNNIEKIKLANKEEKLTINELIPPSFFSVDIILENEINFNSLSSGEKQKIYSVNSILYHINNINSVDSSLIQYKKINIILDEIELYFHPELQRNYLTYLLHSISKANTNNVLGINILFVTHSPFILSDIPDSKILFLEKNINDIKAKTINSKRNIKTFGANIHELLINGFFMNDSSGEFSLKKIKQIVDFHYKVMQNNENQEGLDILKKKYINKKEEFYFIQEHIGEEYITGIIKNHIEDIERKLNHKNFRTKRIEDLESELAHLKGNLNVEN